MDAVLRRLLDRHQHKAWAVLPHYLDGLIQKAAGQEAFFFGEAAEPKPLAYAIEGDGVAVVSLHGPLLKEPDAWEKERLGAVSTVEAEQVIRAALGDPRSKALLLDIDSPGGTVDGSFSLAEAVYGLRGEKPIIAFGNGLIASAGYLLASAADQIVLNESGEAGSIGVRMTHVDWTKWNEKYGLKVTIITTGKYKAAGDPDLALDDEALAYFQGIVNENHALFTEKVARNRGISLESVLPVADGRVFIGRNALSNQLVDAIGERADALRLASEYKNMRAQSREERKPNMGMIDAIKRILAGKPLEEGDPAEATEVVETVKAALTEEQAQAAQAEARRQEAEAAKQAKDAAAADAKTAGPTKEEIVEAERARAKAITESCKTLGLDADATAEIIGSEMSEGQALAAAIRKAAEKSAPLAGVTNRTESPEAAAKTEIGKGLLESAQRLAAERNKKTA